MTYCIFPEIQDFSIYSNVGKDETRFIEMQQIFSERDFHYIFIYLSNRIPKIPWKVSSEEMRKFSWKYRRM